MTAFPDPQYVDANGVRLAIYEADGDPDREHAPVILVHGWPEIAYSWKQQLPAMAEAGFRAIALDLKGFGGSDAPRDKTQYDIRHMTNDLAALLDALGVDKAVFCGHDWGGALVWPMAQLHPSRVAGVIGVCTPHRPPPPVAPLKIIEKRFTAKHYFIQFQEEGVPEALFETDVEKFFRIMFRAPPKRSEWEKLVPRIYDLPGRFRDGPAPDMKDVIVSRDDLQVFVNAYRQSGFHGGVNLYRNVDRNYEITKSVNPVVPHEALWIGAENDLFLPPEGADDMEKIVPNVEKKIIADCGHWVMWEKPEELNSMLVEWLLRKMSS
jgi:microsomal epoxide hydrolase/non-specific protein-tyrosine kinase